MTPIVALSARNMHDLPGIKENIPAAAITHDYLMRVVNAGGIPLVVPPLGELPVELLDRVDGLVLSGGEDIAPERYGKPPSPHLGTVDLLRDALELALVTEAVARRMPILAICRGAQVLNVALGGTLIQDLPSEYPSDVRHRQEAACTQGTHVVRLAPDSLLSGLWGSTELSVNSFHHQAALDVAPGLRAVAWAPDGVIEALEGAGAFMVGVQWHPECQESEFSPRLFGAFVEACRAYAIRRRPSSAA